jgi:dihydrolipoamide dehydrogenase
MKNYDVIVIGGGPGGYVAAIRAAQLGMKTAVIEKSHLGGICLNWGCIPTKALLRASEVYHTIEQASEFGFEVGKPKINFEKLIKRSRDVAAKLSSGIGHLLKKNKVDVLMGHGKLLGNGKVKVDSEKGAQEVSAKHIILATGARARVLPGLEPDGKVIWSYKEAMVPTTMPKSMLIVGSGAIGVEFASFYNLLGVKVTIAELHAHILNAEDEEIALLAQKALQARGIRILAHTQVKKVASDGKEAKVTLIIDGKETVEKFDRVISAVGVVANIEDLGLDKTKVKLEKGFIKTDDRMRTAEPGVYAIGDITAPPWLAHKASHEGVICVEAIAGKEVHAIDRNNIPACTYCSPQIASIGLTEKEAKEQGYEIKVGRFPFVGNGKAIAMGEPEGLVKTVFDAKTGELLGAHMVGAEVTEMIQGFAIAKSMEATELDLMQTIFPHPTMSEMMHESVLAAFNRALHI